MWRNYIDLSFDNIVTEKKIYEFLTKFAETMDVDN